MNPLLKFRTEIGATQSDLALLLDLSRQSISAIEDGLWEHFPRETHLTLKPIAHDEFGYPWPQSYEELEKAYQASRVARRLATRQRTWVARSLRSQADALALTKNATVTHRHPFSVWRERAVGSTSLRGFCKLIAINPELVKDYETSRPFGAVPNSLREALLDCGVRVDLLETAVAEYWTLLR